MLRQDPVLSKDQLRRLGEHKYRAEGKSILDDTLQHWWNWVVQCIPLWLAPNLITITGLIINIATSLIIVYYNPNGKEETPRWAALLCALGLFFYQTLDAIDGKQARRTGSSSPLGELFDHGCDSLSTVFVALAACLTVGLGTHPWVMFFQCFTGLALFYCAHWQTYVSGILRFGKIDVTEAQYGIMSLHLITALFGSKIWHLQIPLIGTGANILVSVAIGCLQLYTLATILITVLSGGSGKNGSTIAGTSVLSPAIPLSFVIIPAYVIACKSQQQIFELHPSLYIIAFGLVAAKVTNRLVVAHMTRSEMAYFDSSMYGPALLFFNQYFSTYFDEYYLLWISLVWAAIDLLRYSSSVCGEICKALNIQLFRINPRVAVPVGAASGAAEFLNGSRNGRHRRQ